MERIGNVGVFFFQRKSQLWYDIDIFYNLYEIVDSNGRGKSEVLRINLSVGLCGNISWKIIHKPKVIVVFSSYKFPIIKYVNCSL